MFTELIRKGKWSYMFLAAVATLAVAALATLANTPPQARPRARSTTRAGKQLTEAILTTTMALQCVSLIKY
jgi:hypothetical protein